MILEENQLDEQEDEVEMNKQNVSCPTYKARSLSKKSIIQGYKEEMSHEKGIQSICVLGQNHFVSMSCDKQIKIWDYIKQEAVFQFQNGYNGNNNIIRIGFDHFLLISGDRGQQLQLIEWNEMKIIQSLNLDEKIIYLDVSQASTQDHKIICGDQKGSIHLLNINLNLLQQIQTKQNQNYLLPLKFVKKIKNKDNSIPMQNITSICFLEDQNKLVVGGEKGSLYFYNIAKSKIYKHIPKAHVNGRKVSFIAQVFQSQKQFVISCGHDQIIKIFDEETCTNLKTLALNNPIICGVQIDSQFAAIGEGRHVQLLNLQSLTTDSLALHKTRVNVIALDQEKQNIIIGDINGTLKVWSLKKEQKSIQQQNLQLSQRSRHSHHEFSSSIRKSSHNKLIYDETLDNVSQKQDQSNQYIRYNLNQQKYIKNSLNSSEKKYHRTDSQGKLIQQKQQNFNASSCASNLEYNRSTEKKTAYNSSTFNRDSEISNNIMTNSYRGLRNNITLRSSSGKKITNFIVPLQYQNQMILDSLSQQSSQQKGNINESYSRNIVEYDKENNGQKHIFDGIENMQSQENQNQNNLLQNLIQRTYLDSLQKTKNNEQIQNEKSINLESTIQEIEQIKNDSNHDIINQLNVSRDERDQQTQSERKQAQQDLYYDLIKQQANKNYLQKGYMNPQTPNQTINQYCSEDAEQVRKNETNQQSQKQYYQIQGDYNNQNILNQSVQQISKSNMCEPFDISEDGKLKLKLEQEESNLRNQIKQEVEEFRNSIIKAQSSKSLCQSLQEKSLCVIDPSTVGLVSSSIHSQHCSNNSNNQHSEQQDIKLDNLISNQQPRVDGIINKNEITKIGFQQQQNQIQKQEFESSNNISKNYEQNFESQQFASNFDLNESNQITQRKIFNSNSVKIQQQQQSYEDFKNRLYILEEQELLNKQQIDEIKQLTNQNYEENIQIKNELQKIKTKLIENQNDQSYKLQKNLSQTSSKKSLFLDSESNQQTGNQFLSPQKNKERLVNRYQGSERKTFSKDGYTKNDENYEVEENQLKKNLRQQINDTISNHKKQSQQSSVRNSQKLSAQKFQTPNNQLKQSENQSPSKKYVELNKKYVSPLKVNWKYINEESDFSEKIKSSQLNNKMRSLSTDFLGIRRHKEILNLQQQYQEQLQTNSRNLNYDYNQGSQRNRQYSANNDNRPLNIEQNQQQCKAQQISQNQSIFDTSNHVHSNTINIRDEDFLKNLQNISSIETDKQSLRNNFFYTTTNSQQNNQIIQNNENQQQGQQNKQNMPVQLNSFHSNSLKNQQIKQTSQEIIETKKNNFKQLQNITKGSEVNNGEKISSSSIQVNQNNKFINNEPKFILKNYIYNPQNYKLQNFGLKDIKNNSDQYNQKIPSKYQIGINAIQNQNLLSAQKQYHQNNVNRIIEEKEDNMDTFQNISQSINQPLSSFLTNVQTNQTKINMITQQNEQTQISNPQQTEKGNNVSLFSDSNKEKYEEQKRQEILYIQNSQNFSMKVQKEFTECIHGMKGCLQQNKNDLELLKQEIKSMENRRKNSKGRDKNHYSTALNFIQQQNEQEWEGQQKFINSHKK